MKQFNLLLFPLCFIYFELIFLCTTDGFFSFQYLACMTLFSFCYGGIITVISHIIPSKIIRKIFNGIVLFGVPILYLGNHFIYMEFKVLYDLNTMFAGAGDAFGGFSEDIKGLIFSSDGFLCIILYYMPFVLYLIKSKSALFQLKFSLKELVIEAVIYGMVFFYCIFSIQSDEGLFAIYDEQYNYTDSVRTFGLLTGMRLDAQRGGEVNDEDESFDFVEITEETTEDSKQEKKKDDSEEQSDKEEKQEPVVYGKNELSIDFAKMAEEPGNNCADLDAYIASQEPSSQNEYTGLFKGKNLIFLTAEAFSEEVIDKDLTPTLWRLANKGIQFTDYYQFASAGTTGGEYNNIMGMPPTSGGSSMKKTATHCNYMTIGSLLDKEGYYGKAYHNNDYKYYDRDKTHINLGYSDGYEGYGNGIEEVVTSQWPESDLEMIQGTLPTYINKPHFNIYYMTVSGHSLYSQGTNAMTRKHWDEVQDLEYSDKVKAYIACQLELEAALSYLVKELEKKGIADDTVICIGTDHFPYGLDIGTELKELYGVDKISNNFVRDHNRLIIWSGSLEKEDPIVVDTPVSSIDILPTLCNLFGIEYDSRLLPGRDVFSDAVPIVFDLGYNWKTDKGTYSSGKFTPVNEQEQVSDEYIENMKTIVKNKINFSRGVLNKDYYRHVFEEEH